tara:strand:- start:3950 stop:5386 length:1437 start_codon:yes stop_codon:yes gene_type:complete
MKLLLENWRKYLLTEISIEQALADIGTSDENPGSQRVNKIIQNYMLPGLKMGEYKNEEETFWELHAQLRNNLAPDMGRDIIPKDLLGVGEGNPQSPGGQKKIQNRQAQSIRWLLIKASGDERLANHLIDGVTHSEYENIYDNLELFFQHKRLMSKKDLMQVKSYEELISIVDEARPKIEEKRQEGVKDPKLIMEGTEFFRGEWEIKTKIVKDEEGNEVRVADLDAELEILPGKGGWVIMGIHNKAASCFHGGGPRGRRSDWCTADAGLDYFNQYYKVADPLFIFETPGGEWFQFHYGREEFMHAFKSRRVAPQLFEKLHGELIKTEAYEKYQILKMHDLNRMARIGFSATIGEIKALIDHIPKEKWERFLAPLAAHVKVPSKKVKPEVLRLLATKEFEDISGIARYLALNPDTPIDALEYIAEENRYGGNRKLAREELETRKEWEENYPGRGARQREMLRPAESERFSMRENFARFLK